MEMNEKEKELYKAIKNNDIEKVKLILENEEYIDNMALMLASKYGNLEIVKYLVESGADINVKDNSGNTALMYALETVEYLISNGADINAKNIYGKTALAIAARSGNLEIVKYLIEKGADNINKALEVALEYGDLETVKYLIEKGVDITKNAALIMVLSNVVERIEDMNKASSNRLEIVKYLVEKGVDINSKSIALIRACWNCRNLETVKYLVEHGADINAKDKSGNTALMIAFEYGNLEIVKYLVEHGADINVKDKSGNTALMITSKDMNLEMVKYLVEHGADVNAKNMECRTALYLVNEEENSRNYNLYKGEYKRVIRENSNIEKLIEETKEKANEIIKVLKEAGAMYIVSDERFYNSEDELFEAMFGAMKE